MLFECVWMTTCNVVTEYSKFIKTKKDKNDQFIELFICIVFLSYVIPFILSSYYLKIFKIPEK